MEQIADGIKARADTFDQPGEDQDGEEVIVGDSGWRENQITNEVP